MRRAGVDGDPERPPLPARGAAQLGHLFPHLPSQDALHKRRARLAETIEWLIGVFAAQSPGSARRLCCCSTRHRSSAAARVETTRRSQLADVCGYGYSEQPLALVLGDAAPPRLRPGWHAARGGARLCRPARTGSRANAAAARARRRRDDRLRQGLRRPRLRQTLSPTSARSSSGRRAQTEPQTGPHLAPIRQRIESVFWTCKDLLYARTPRRPHATQPLRADRRPGSSPSPPASASTTNSADQAAQSPPTPPNAWHQPSRPGLEHCKRRFTVDVRRNRALRQAFAARSSATRVAASSALRGASVEARVRRASTSPTVTAISARAA